MSKEVFIIAGGPSLRGFDFHKLRNRDAIAVNKAILDVPFSKFFITIDYTFLDRIEQKTDGKMTRKDFNTLTARKYFVVAKDNAYIKEINGRFVDVRSNYKYDLKEFDKVIVSKQALGIGNSFETFVHGCNSGFSAIQLAVLLGYTTIHLLGFDLKIDKTTHYHKGYNLNIRQFENKLQFYHPYYLVGIHNLFLNFPNVKLYNYSKNSKLDGLIEYKSLEEI